MRKQSEQESACPRKYARLQFVPTLISDLTGFQNFEKVYPGLTLRESSFVQTEVRTHCIFVINYYHQFRTWLVFGLDAKVPETELPVSYGY